MDTTHRRGGIIFLKVDGERHDAKGSFSYNIGRPVREAIIGSDGVQGYKETPQVASIEGEVTDHANLSLDSLLDVRDATITLELANGKVIVLRNAWFAGPGGVHTDEGNITVKFEGLSGEEIQ